MRSTQSLGQFSLLSQSLITLLAVFFSGGCSTESGASSSQNSTADAEMLESLDANPSMNTIDASVTDASIDADAALMATRLSVGYAERNITPALGAILGGFGGPGDERRATGVHDPLMAQAIWFSNDASQNLLIISIDVAGMLYDFGDWGPGIREAREAIVVALAGRVDLKPQEIVITSSHTHAGTDLSGVNQALGDGVDPFLLYQTQWHLVQVALAAFDSQEPAETYLGQTQLEDWTKRDSDCSPVLDNTVMRMRITWPETDRPPLYLLNFANHPTVLGSDNTLFSSDFIWGIRSAAQLNGARAMFLQGFIAAVHGSYNNTNATGFERAEVYGQTLFDAAANSQEVPNNSDYAIENRETVYGCRAKDSFLATLFRYYNMPKRTVTVATNELFVETIPISWHRVGNAEFVVWPGEPSPEYSVLMRDTARGDYVFTVGLGNDAIGYIVEPNSVANDTSNRLAGYEVNMGLGLESGPCALEAMSGLNWTSWSHQDADE